MKSLLRKVESKIISRKSGVISYPKSGRTWVRAIFHDLGIHPSYTHETANRLDEVHSDDEVNSRPHQPFSKFLFIIREPKDIVTSYYFHMTKRFHEFEGSLDDFIDDSEIGMAKTCAFNEKWLNYFQNSDDQKGLMISYEELHQDAPHYINKAIQHFGFRFISEDDVRIAVENNNFKKLKAKEKSGYYKQEKGIGSALNPVDDPEGAKVRKGKIGGYQDYFSDKQIEKCNAIFKNYPLYYELYKDSVT